jgi:NADPH:quinone reductase-like Zn-dependent oxidoreductase
VVVEEQHLTAKPAGVPWEAAGALFVAGTTAYAAVRAVGLTEGDTVVVSAAAGGVGSISVQLARLAGATVIGLASEAHHAWLAGRGVIPVAYGDAIADRIRQAASKVDARACGSRRATFSARSSCCRRRRLERPGMVRPQAHHPR